ncbi:4a-hydroxytetrahydrobiopterin dehydratase [Occultella aeris]|uniref:Putative pterin-4-alpha-carbinolamine dehydratase n=1 Tax=Occultella aeris TaxID=2761496 RepID=A0A7M4DNH3_9MICO|nr:4a-hydroxytetrahydrobiopterin dehydratase [Occultella aeris]VZO38986.1 Putative pterin-4-alpha-carbinolamine dehydratase [Occultella aeris]
MDTLTAEEVSELDGLEDWRVLIRSLHATFRTGSLAEGIAFATRVGAAADAADHHPDLDLRYFRTSVVLTTHSADGLTELDVDLARTISAIAAELGLTPEPALVSVQEIAIDALDIPAVLPFWRAVLGYDDDMPPEFEGDADALGDPVNGNPAVWFQQMDAPRPQRNRIHIDVWVPLDAAEARVQAALDAGGALVSAHSAPSFWVLADPEGNEACVCTAFGRPRD